MSVRPSTRTPSDDRTGKVHAVKTPSNQQDADAALARSEAYGFLATALGYPDRDLADMDASPDRWSAWKHALQRSFPTSAERLNRIRADLPESSDDDRMTALKNVHTDLFGHAVRGRCPPYELEYIRSDIPQRASELADIAGFYEAFGMRMDARAKERSDHAVPECEFMGVLAAREAYAIENENEEARQILSNAQRAFLTDHLGRWLPALSTRLEEADPEGFYGKVGTFAREFIGDDCHRLGAVCGPEFLELSLADPRRDAEIQCGVEESCPGSTPQGSESLVQLRIDRG